MSEPRTAPIPPPANGNGDAPAPSPPGRLTLVRALGETRAVWERGHRAREVVVPAHLPTREWLVRAAFALLALTALATITLAGVGLLGAGEAAGLSLPVVAVASLMIGFYLGSESGREEQRPS
jgi:hypothetical protein